MDSFQEIIEISNRLDRLREKHNFNVRASFIDYNIFQKNATRLQGIIDSVERDLSSKGVDHFHVLTLVSIVQALQGTLRDIDNPSRSAESVNLTVKSLLEEFVKHVNTLQPKGNIISFSAKKGRVVSPIYRKLHSTGSKSNVIKLKELRSEISISQEGYKMTDLDPLATAALTKALDFLFSEASKFMEQRRENRKELGKEDDTPSIQVDDAITTKEEIAALPPKSIYLKDVPREIEFYLQQIEQYRTNRRHTLEQIAHQGGLANASISTRNDLILAENEIKKWSQELKNLVEKVYGHKIKIFGLE